MKEHQHLNNQILVEEEKHFRGRIKETQRGEKVQEVIVNYLHCALEVVQHNSRWKEKIP
jgi:hypothetical protein